MSGADLDDNRIPHQLHVYRRQEMPPPVAARISVDAVTQIFRNASGRRPMPSSEAVQSVADQLNRSWATGYKHGLWELMQAIRVVLDDGPRVVEAEARHRSLEAAARHAAFSQLVAAAQAICDAGVAIPQPDDTPLKTKQAASLANPDHRDWWFVFNLVSAALLDAGWKRVGKTPVSPSVIATYEILKTLGIRSSPDALVKMLKTRGKRDRAKKQGPIPPL